MHIDRFSQEFSRIIAIAETGMRSRELALLLESRGFSYGTRSVDNILLLLPLLSVEKLHRVVILSLLTASPDISV
jgi:repressor of nif and glnA expression